MDNGAEIVTVTNGVHTGSWQDARVRRAFDERDDLWDAHQQAKRDLLTVIADRTGTALREDRLLIGFARRATGYKRATLIFKKRDVIEPLLRQGKIQLVFAGKAHPNDLQGKELVLAVHRMAQRYPGSVVFLQDYDMELGRVLTAGCDVWLNNPVRPLEACGTSGIKAAMNGVLNLSVLDGWWPEGCRHGINGWQIGDGYEGANADRVDAESLYKVLVREVIPAYYKDRTKWRRMMRASIGMALERFSAERMLADYHRLMYKAPARAPSAKLSVKSRRKRARSAVS